MRFSSEEREIEREIVPFLLRMSRLPRGTPAREMLERADERTALGRRLAAAKRDYLKGSGRKPISECIDSAFERFGRNAKISFFVETLKIGIANNFDSADLVRKTAKEMRSVESLESKREAALSIQKYTVLAAGGFFVPFMLGSTVSIISVFSRLSSGLSGFGIAISANPAPLSFSLLAYSLILPVISALFVSLGIEGRKERLPIYLAILIPAAIVSFTLAKSMVA